MRVLDRILKGQSETRQKVIRNIFWAVSGKVVTMLSGLFVGVLVARYLGAEQFGAMNYIISIVTLFGVVAAFGSPEIVIRTLARKEVDDDAVMGTAMVLRLGFAAFTMLLIGGYLLFSGQSAHSCAMILIYSLSVIFGSFDVIRQYFAAQILNEYVVKAEIVRTLFGAGVKVVLLLMEAPLIAFVAALSFDFLLLAMGYITAYRRRVGALRKWRFDMDVARALLKDSFPILLSSAALVVFQRIDQVMIGNMLGDTELGYYSTAASFVAVLLFIPQIIMQTVSPLLVKFYKESEEKYRREAYRVMSLMTWGLLAVCGLAMVCAYPLIRYTYGVEYLAAVPIFQITCFRAVGSALSMSGGHMVIIENLQKYAVIRNILSCSICIGFNLFLIPRFGVIGSAYAAVITMFFQGCFANVLIPPYWHIFRLQIKALFFGWVSLLSILFKR